MTEQDSTPLPETEQSASGATRLIGRLAPKLTEAFAKASIALGGERVLWEVFPIVAPNPMQPGNLSTGIAVFISVPSSLVGQNLAMTPVIDPQFAEVDQEVIDEFARDRLNELLAARRQQVVQQNGAGNGQPSPGGLVLPGQG